MRDESQNSRPQRPQVPWLDLLPYLIGMLASLPALLDGALFDDELLIFANPYTQSFQHLRDNLTHDFFYGPAGLAIGYYRPASKLLFMLEYQLFGARPLAYHVLSMAGFLLTLALGQRLARELHVPRMAAALGLCLFASHPATARTVSTIASQSDLFVVASMLACLIAYVHYRQTGARSWLVLTLLAETIALGFKETAVVMPGLIFVFELDQQQLAIGPALRSRWSYALLPIIVYLVLRVQLGVLPIETPTASQPWTSGAVAAAKSIVAIALRCLAPLGFIPPLHSDRPSADPLSLLRWSLPALLLMAATVVGLLRAPALRMALALLWLPAALVVVGASAIHISEDQGALVISDRWLFLPALGASLLLGIALSRALEHLARPALRLAVLLGFAGLVATQTLVAAEENASYASENTRVLHLAALYRDARDLPRDAPEVLLAADAINAEDSGDVPAAITAHAKLLALKPDDSVRRYNLASALLRGGQLQAALDQAQIAFHGRTLAGVQLFPENDSSGRRRAEKALLLGLIYERLGDAASARRYFAICLSLNPGDPIARSKLAD